MKVELVRLASVRGWCKSKALVEILYYSSVYGYERAVWIESTTPDNNVEAAELNRLMQEIVNKLQ